MMAPPPPIPTLEAGENIAIGGFPTIAGTDNGNFSIISVTPGSFVTDNSSGVPYTFSTGPDATGTASTGASGPSVAVCNHDGSICASPDTGFLTVTNNTESLSPVRYLSPAHRPAVERPRQCYVRRGVSRQRIIRNSCTVHRQQQLRWIQPATATASNGERNKHSLLWQRRLPVHATQQRLW